MKIKGESNRGANEIRHGGLRDSMNHSRTTKTVTQYRQLGEDCVMIIKLLKFCLAAGKRNRFTLVPPPSTLLAITAEVAGFPMLEPHRAMRRRKMAVLWWLLHDRWMPPVSPYLATADGKRGIY